MVPGLLLLQLCFRSRVTVFGPEWSLACRSPGSFPAGCFHVRRCGCWVKPELYVTGVTCRDLAGPSFPHRPQSWHQLFWSLCSSCSELKFLWTYHLFSYLCACADVIPLPEIPPFPSHCQQVTEHKRASCVQLSAPPQRALASSPSLTALVSTLWISSVRVLWLMVSSPCELIWAGSPPCLSPQDLAGVTRTSFWHVSKFRNLFNCCAQGQPIGCSFSPLRPHSWIWRSSGWVR